LTAAQTATTSVVVKDASEAANTSDVLNVVTKVAASDVNVGTLTVADVENINITATDTNVDEDKDGTSYETGDRDLSTLDLDATSAKSVVIDGNANLNLDMTGNTKATLVDATELGGGLTVTTTAAEQTVQGGQGADSITVDTAKAEIFGNDGADTITVNSTATSAIIDGGAGADTFDITGAALGVEAFATFNNVEAGDVFKINAGSFSSDEVDMTLDDPSTSDWINAAFSQTTQDQSIWFQHNNNTYLVVNDATNGTDAYDADYDVVVKLTGLVDLSEASFNAGDGTLEMA
jgi:S-layer protein